MSYNSVKRSRSLPSNRCLSPCQEETDDGSAAKVAYRQRNWQLADSIYFSATEGGDQEWDSGSESAKMTDNSSSQMRMERFHHSQACRSAYRIAVSSSDFKADFEDIVRQSDSFAYSDATEDCQQIDSAEDRYTISLQTVPKVIFDRMARELVKSKTEAAKLKRVVLSFNKQLQEAHKKLKSYEKCCQMSVDFNKSFAENFQIGSNDSHLEKDNEKQCFGVCVPEAERGGIQASIPTQPDGNSIHPQLELDVNPSRHIHLGAIPKRKCGSAPTPEDISGRDSGRYPMTK